MIEVWRIVKTRYVDTAFDGEGARRSGGRWNSPGRPLIYTSATLSLAILEIFVHLRDQAVLSSYSAIAANVPEELVQQVAGLPSNWREYPAPPSLQTIGDVWIESRRSAVLRVPSAVVETEFNYLLNPAHHRFNEIEIGDPRPFELDPRLASERRASMDAGRPPIFCRSDNPAEYGGAAARGVPSRPQNASLTSSPRYGSDRRV